MCKIKRDKIGQKSASDRAFTFALLKHGDQKDDNGEVFFWAHPHVVGLLLKKVAPDDDNLIAAGYLHDVIEDTNVTYNNLVEEFGKDIADLVHEVTDEILPDGTKIFPRLHSQRGTMLKFADRLSNLSRMQAWNEKRKDQYVKKSKFWRSE